MKILSNNAYNKLLMAKEIAEKQVVSLASENQVINARLEAKSQIIADTKKELGFYRGLAERERDRADRAVDNLSNVSINMPVSELGLTRVKESVKEDEDILAKQLKEVSEIYSDVMASVTGTESN